MRASEGPVTSAHLAGRGIVSVAGEDSTRFLQGLLTCNLERLGEGVAMASGLLSPQGKILFEMLVLRTAGEILLDCPRELAADLVKRLQLYRLRAKVALADRSSELEVWAAWGKGPLPDGTAFADPRSRELGRRAIVRLGIANAAASQSAWHAHRIACGIPELGSDYEPGEVFPHEALLDQTGAVDFRKGCYVGQEVVSRMEHRGTARSRFVIAEGPPGSELPPRGTEVLAGDVPLGAMGSHAGEMGLALLRLDRLADAKSPPAASGIPLTVRKPPYARFSVPGAAP